MLLKHFCDDEGYLWVGDSSTKRVWKTKPCNAFKIKHLYTKNLYDKVTGLLSKRDYTYEEALSSLEDTAAPIVEDIVTRVRSGECPVLSLRHETAIKEFMFAMARRTPESQYRVISTRNFEDIFYTVAKQMADIHGHPLPEKNKLYESLQIVRLATQVRRNVFARFAAGDDERMRKQVQRLCNDTGLAYVAIRITNKGFVIGSHGIGILENDREERHSFLPLAHDLCVWLSPYPDRAILHNLDQRGEQLIERMNEDTVARSRRIAGPCENVIRSLIRSNC